MMSAITGEVLSFGELLLRITPDSDGMWLHNNCIPFFIGGAELNVSTALALWNIPSSYCTALPNNGLSAQIVTHLESKRINLSQVCYHGQRMGLYFLTQGHDLKHDALIYDRANSSFSQLDLGMIDWEKVFDGVSWFHFSAICPAINANVAAVCLEAVKVAAVKNIKISIDLNYRSKLWQYGKLPSEVIPELVQYCDVIMGNIWAIELMLGIPVRKDIHKLRQKGIYIHEAQQLSGKVKLEFPKCNVVANTYRFDNDQQLNYYSTLHVDSKFYISKEYSTTAIVDKVGSGDCYMAGLIYGFYNNLLPQQIVEFATAAAFTKLFVKSDATNQTVEDIYKAMQA